MNEKEFDLLVFIGRFQPFHNEHKRIIDIALEKSKHVLVLIGSAGKARTVRNPWTYHERAAMIEENYIAEISSSQLTTAPLFDKTYNEPAWIKQVQSIVHKKAHKVINKDLPFPSLGSVDAKIGLIGAEKDHTSYYLKMFPQWESVSVGIENPNVNSTDIRNSYFAENNDYVLLNILPDNVIDFLYGASLDEHGFDASPHFETIKKELVFIKNYKKSWEAAPYPVKHMTVDCVVEQSGHILVIRRRSEPGKGLWALPGGHLNEFETLEDGAIRELKEETKIKVPEAVLRGSIAAHRTFDDPHRSTIGRVITQAYHIKLNNSVTLPKIKGSDDADKAIWLPISDMREDMFFDDHFHVINFFLGV